MISGIVIEGLIYGIVVLGTFMTFRVLNFCDMTVDGSFPMGACVLAACLTGGVPPALALLLVFLCGMLAGLVTTLIHTKLKVPDLLAGILVMTMLYSVNLRIMGNHANISLRGTKTIFSQLTAAAEVAGFSSEASLAILLVVIIAVLLFVLNLFFHTDFGLTMGALGCNEQMIISQGVNPQFLRGVGICLSNGMAATAGAFFAMYQNFADVGSGTGVVVACLASLMLGEFLIKSNKISLQIIRVIIGSVLYRALMFWARRYGYRIGMSSNDLRLITGLLIIICLLISKTNLQQFFREHLGGKKSAQKEGTK